LRKVGPPAARGAQEVRRRDLEHAALHAGAAPQLGVSKAFCLNEARVKRHQKAARSHAAGFEPGNF
jgi:hypothetical protein